MVPALPLAFGRSAGAKTVPLIAHAYVENVLIVGVSHLTELFLESVAEYASKRVDVVGILSEERELRGRLLRFHKVLGTPEELPRVMAQLEVHGVTLERIVVMQPFEQLSPLARDALLDVEEASSVRVDWITELLGLTVNRGRNDEQTRDTSARITSAGAFGGRIARISILACGFKARI